MPLSQYISLSIYIRIYLSIYTYIRILIMTYLLQTCDTFNIYGIFVLLFVEKSV